MDIERVKNTAPVCVPVLSCTVLGVGFHWDSSAQVNAGEI